MSFRGNCRLQSATAHRQRSTAANDRFEANALHEMMKQETDQEMRYPNVTFTTTLGHLIKWIKSGVKSGVNPLMPNFSFVVQITKLVE